MVRDVQGWERPSRPPVPFPAWQSPRLHPEVAVQDYEIWKRERGITDEDERRILDRLAENKAMPRCSICKGNAARCEHGKLRE